MKKILAVLVLAAGALHAQVSNPSIIQPPSSPAGNSCTNQLPLQVYQGVLYSCQSGVVTALGGSGTVTSVSVTTANGVSGVVATATTTPAISLTLGAITPSSVAATGAVSSSTFVTAAEYDNSTCTTSKTISAANGNRQKVTLTAGDACALTFTQPSSGTISVTLKVIQSSSASYNGTISGCKWPGGTVPTITATTGAIDFISIYMDGTNAYCAALQNFS